MDGGYPAGGSRELAELIDQYGEYLVPDLKHYYGIDLRDLFSEASPLSPRFVLAYIKNLPLESSFYAEVRGGQKYRGWGEERYMAASELNVLRLLLHVLILANTDPKKTRHKAPEPYPTPDKPAKKQADRPGSFAFIAKQHIAAAKRKKGTNA